MTLVRRQERRFSLWSGVVETNRWEYCRFLTEQGGRVSILGPSLASVGKVNGHCCGCVIVRVVDVVSCKTFLFVYSRESQWYMSQRESAGEREMGINQRMRRRRKKISVGSNLDSGV